MCVLEFLYLLKYWLVGSVPEYFLLFKVLASIPEKSISVCTRVFVLLKVLAGSVPEY